MTALVLYHDNCMDGFMSAYLMYIRNLSHGEETEFIGVTYNEPIPDVKNKKVYIVDFSYPKEILMKAACDAVSITMVDHHITALRDYNIPERKWTFMENADGKKNIAVYLDMERSGCKLVLDMVWTNPTERIKRLVNAVEDRDLWRFKYSDTKYIVEALRSLDQTFEAYNKVMYLTENEFDTFIQNGNIVWNTKNEIVKTISSKYKTITIDGISNVAVCNCPSMFSSAAGEILSAGRDMSLTYSIGNGHVFCSLRGSPESNVDTSLTAKKFGGGGHKKASGFKVSIAEAVALGIL